MTSAGILLAWIEPHDATNEEFLRWHRNGGFAESIPGLNMYSALFAQDDVEEVKPYRFQVAYFIRDPAAITSEVYQKAVSASSKLVKSTEWHLYKSLLAQNNDGYETLPAGSVCIQVGQTPETDPAVIADFEAWFRQEHLPKLTRVPGWQAGRRMQFLRHVGGEPREYCAPFIANHRYLAENGLNGPEWQGTLDTEWTLKVRSHMTKPNHRRVWRIENEVLVT